VNGTLELVRRSALLAECSPTEIDGVVRRSAEVMLSPGELLFGEDDRAEAVWVVLEGELAVSTMVDGEEVVVDRLQPGAYLGEISLLTGGRAHHRARGVGTVRLLRIPGDAFRDLLHSCDHVFASVLRTLAGRVRRAEHVVQQHERMAGLGTLAAGLAHELKNPAAAAHRASELLREQFAEVGPLARRLASHPWAPEEVRLLEQLERAAAGTDGSVRELDALARSDREEALVAWLEAHDIAHGWGLAPVLVDVGVETEQLDRLTRNCSADVVADAFAWTERMATIRQLLDEMGQSTSRIHEMVKAMKAYSHVGTSIRTADVHESIEQSLNVLSHKLREVNATVEREYDRSLPDIETYGTELNQVWTNLLDNAADAVATATARTIRIRTSRDGERALVEITDSGPGIAAGDSERIFDPFYTTKSAGNGTGLGLEIVRRIVRRHQGSIDVTSSAGATRFTVRVPIRQGVVAPVDSRGDPPVRTAGAPNASARGGAGPPTGPVP
jgi:signal transduction histidine kinase